MFFRSLKQDESKYRDYNYEERVRHSITSSRDYVGGSEKTSTRPVEKLGQKDDGHFGEQSAERRIKSDIRSSPLQLVDKSPSSSTDRRQFSRTDVRRSIDVEESIQRSSGSRDWKEFSGKDGRGSREFGMDVPGEELSQADADPVLSPYVRNSHFSSSSKPLPPFRTGVDSPSMLGSAEDDGRGKPNIRHRRMVDPNTGRMQGNAWRGVQSWHSPVPNGFLPFPHVQPAVSFHSVMQPFHSPSMFSVRPSMDLGHPSPYHMPDADRFAGPGRPMGWRSQVDDSCPPLPAWDASNALFGDESHIYGRPDWDHSRNLPGSRGWETSVDLWKGPNRTTSMEALSSEKENNSIRSGDGAMAGQSIQPSQNEQSRVLQQADSTGIDLSTKSSPKNDIDISLATPEDTEDVKMSVKDDVPLWHAYLSKLDISADLTEPELFNKCTGLMDVKEKIFSDVDDYKILYMEVMFTADDVLHVIDGCFLYSWVSPNIVFLFGWQDTKAKMASSHRLLRYTLFASSDDSVFQVYLLRNVSYTFFIKKHILMQYVSSCNLMPQNHLSTTVAVYIAYVLTFYHPNLSLYDETITLVPFLCMPLVKRILYDSPFILFSFLKTARWFHERAKDLLFRLAFCVEYIISCSPITIQGMLEA